MPAHRTALRALCLVATLIGSAATFGADPAAPTTAPSTRPIGPLSLVCPGGRLGDFRHGGEAVLYFDGRHLVDVRADGRKPDQPFDGFRAVVFAGVDLYPDPAKGTEKAVDDSVYPIADGVVVDLVGEEKDPAFRSLGFAVLVRHRQKVGGRETYSLYGHLREAPGQRSAGGDEEMMKKPGPGNPATQPAAAQPAAGGDAARAPEEPGTPVRLLVGDEVTAGKTYLGSMGDSGAPGGGRRAHVEVRHFPGWSHRAWRGPYGIPGLTFHEDDFKRDWIDPEHFFALARPDVPALVRLLKASDAAGRKAAADDLALLGPDAAAPTDARPALREALGDKEFEVRTAAADALVAACGDGPAAVPAVVELLNDANAFARVAAAQGLGRVGLQAKDRAVPALIKALGDSDPFVRGYAAGSLGQFAPQAADAVGPLRDVLKKDDRPEPLFAAARSLAAFGPAAKDAVPDVVAALPRVSPTLRAGMIRLLPDFGPDAKAAAGPAIKGMRQGPDDQVRTAAEEVLRQWAADEPETP